MIRKRHSRITDARGEHFQQGRRGRGEGDRAEAEQEHQQQNDSGRVDVCGVRRAERVLLLYERRAQFSIEPLLLLGGIGRVALVGDDHLVTDADLGNPDVGAGDAGVVEPKRRHGIGGDVARRREFAGAKQIELYRAVRRIRCHHDRGLVLGLLQRRVGKVREALEDGNGQHRRQDIAADVDRTPSYPVRQVRKDDVQRRRQQCRDDQHEVRCQRLDLQDLDQEEQRVELAGVPQHGLRRQNA
ncbi:hypothetical protein D3C86_1208650 [compost metagenome]